MSETVFIFLFFCLLACILGLYTYKAGLQLQYLRVKQGKPKGTVGDFFRFSNAKERTERWKAFLLFPLTYALVFEEDEKEELVQIKKTVKKIHVGIYLTLVILIVLGIYSEKVFTA